MKFFALVPKMYYNDPSVMTLKQVIGAATRGGAAAQGREDTGVLKEGNKADLIVIDLSSPHMHPVHDLCANLVHSAAPQDIVMTMVDGRVLYENGEFTTIDIEKAVYEADEATAEILGKLREDN
jgi:5-methylthioadenosine/S-adenosylhomocysteine deaminase